MTENLEKSAKILSTMLSHLGLKAEVSIKEINGKSVLAAESHDAGRIIGKRGQTLQNLELLLNRIATKNDPETAWISINVDGYSARGFRDSKSKKNTGSATGGARGYHRRERRSGRPEGKRSFSSFKARDDRKMSKFRDDFDNTENLTKMAVDSAKEVKKWGEPITLKAMNAHDRRVVHVALKDDPEIKTESISADTSDKLKNIVISLNNNTEPKNLD